jgi:hypothetical protein
MLLKLYINFFKHLKSSNEKNLKLQSRKYHRELQFSYKFHLHPTSYQIVIILQRFCPHHTTVSANSHSVLATLSHSRGHCNRSNNGRRSIIERLAEYSGASGRLKII